MSDINQTTEYSNVVTNVRAAIRGELTSVNKWQTAGEFVRKFYGAESAINEVKAQFIADAIIPELGKAHQAALVRELPRKGSAEYVAFIQAHGEQSWADANQAKKDARSVAHTMFSRVVGYAFPKAKAERVPTELRTRITENVTALIKACQKAEGADFDIGATIAALEAALKIVNK